MLSADAADATSPFAMLSGTAFGVDFNPMADRLRIVSDTEQNLRANVDTGATTTDATLNRGAFAVTAAAYTNNFARHRQLRRCMSSTRRTTGCSRRIRRTTAR